MTPAVHGLLIWALLFGGLRAGGQSPAGGAQRPGTETRVTLSNDHPEGSFLIPPEILAAPPAVLALTMTQVINPAKTAFQIFVYLSYHPGSGEKRRAAPAKILIGNVSLYPPDRPAGFLLRASTAFRKLKAATSKSSDVRLVLEMKRIHPAKPWTPVEVTVAPPEWRTGAE
ncbi:MAG TPA: hypothetical protein VGW33_06245 [Terriglobia bacterium]|nr:hypothetical protein [Terriglobia bacterium]